MPDYWDKNVTCDDAAAGTVTMATMARGSGDRKLDNTRPAQRSRTRDVVLRAAGVGSIKYREAYKNKLEKPAALDSLDINDETI